MEREIVAVRVILIFLAIVFVNILADGLWTDFSLINVYVVVIPCMAIFKIAHVVERWLREK